MTLNKKFGIIRTLSIITFIVLLATFLILVGYRLISGRSLGLRSFAENQFHAIKSRALAISNHASIVAENEGDYTNIIFLHHSTGRNLIEQGNVREILTESGYQFWDHDYNYIGLRDPAGQYTGYSYIVPDDNTDPDGLHEIFGQNSYQQPLNTLSALLQHEVIVVKSCFPASNIVNEAELEQRKSWNLAMRDIMDQHPDKVFILLTSPPLNPAETTVEVAANARILSNWLASEDFKGGHPNIFVFDFFDSLAEDAPEAVDFNMLRQEYRDGTDSHPNQVANETIGPIFAKFIIEITQDYLQLIGEYPN
jgi:hypothetical protein